MIGMQALHFIHQHKFSYPNCNNLKSLKAVCDQTEFCVSKMFSLRAAVNYVVTLRGEHADARNFLQRNWLKFEQIKRHIIMLKKNAARKIRLLAVP